MIDETVRLYSKQPRCPVDVVAPQHAQWHHDLERWGTWNRERYQPKTCESLEKNYDRTGGRAPSRAIVSLPTDPVLITIDKTVRHMMVEIPTHGMTVKLFYVQRREPFVICRAVHIHWRDFGTWMFDTRAMLINLARRHES